MAIRRLARRCWRDGKRRVGCARQAVIGEHPADTRAICPRRSPASNAIAIDIPRRWVSTCAATGCASSSSPPGTGRWTSSRSPRGRRARRTSRRRWSIRPSRRSCTLRASIWGSSRRTFGVMMDPVFCTKIASRLDADLHRSSRTEGLVARTPQRGGFQAAAEFGLGRTRTQRCAEGLRRVRTSFIFTSCATSWSGCCSASIAWSLPATRSRSCRPASRSTLPVGPTTDIFAHS